MKILALEPYYDGSHKAFIDGWIASSSHEFELITAPGHSWKWRMRHCPVTFAQQACEIWQTFKWDAIFTCDMLSLAEFCGLIPPKMRAPAVIYFHENQFTYPGRHSDPRDIHFGLTNMTSALSADQVWFNSDYHRQDFLAGLDKMLAKMPRPNMRDQVQKIAQKSFVQYPGIKAQPADSQTKSDREPLRIIWSARWEHDKNPADFFDAIRQLKNAGVRFQLGVLGQSFRDVPECFPRAREEFSAEIKYWGYQKSRADYQAVLNWADVAVSTAAHEFFGISMVESALANARPVVPDRLAYPELFPQQYRYENSPETLAETLRNLAMLKQKSASVLPADFADLQKQLSKLCWATRAREMDRQISLLAD